MLVFAWQQERLHNTNLKIPFELYVNKFVASRVIVK